MELTACQDELRISARHAAVVHMAQVLMARTRLLFRLSTMPHAAATFYKSIRADLSRQASSDMRIESTLNDTSGISALADLCWFDSTTRVLLA
mmetsp:Transcript_65087/g.128718  ORF Transcript_65087/g.128718 Transcript_65087/m.128718 type:complete len:93 (+) Transcript_65087:104-382(+)